MPTILDLPDEIHLLIAKHFKPQTVYSLIRVCHSFYYSYFPCLWPDLNVAPAEGKTIDDATLRIHAHLVESINFPPSLMKQYYAIDFPRLRTLQLEASFWDKRTPCYSKDLLAQKVDFVRRHSFIRKLVYQHKDTEPKEFWEVIGTELMHLEVLNFSGIVMDNAQDVFWRICDRVQSLHLSGVDLHTKNTSILSTLLFQRLQTLAVLKYSWIHKFPYRAWPLQLLEQVKMSPGLKQLQWNVSDVPLPVQRLQEMFVEEGSWPTLCDLYIGDSRWTDQVGAEMLRALPSRRLTMYNRSSGSIFWPLTFDCLREMYFGHLRELMVRGCKGFTSVMAQEVLMECVHLVIFQAPHIFVRDIATAPKPWGCLRLERLKIYFAKEPGCEAEWESHVFEQLGRLRQLLFLNLERISYLSAGDVDQARPHSMETLDLRLPCSRLKGSSNANDVVKQGGEGGNAYSERGANISCWSSLVQLQMLAFDGGLQKVGMKEALWMVEHWRDLERVYGEFRGIGGVEDDDVDKITRVFTDSHVFYHNH